MLHTDCGSLFHSDLLKQAHINRLVSDMAEAGDSALAFTFVYEPRARPGRFLREDRCMSINSLVLARCRKMHPG